MNQDVVVTGTHIPLAGCHQRIRRTVVAVSIGMVLTGDQLIGLLTLLLQTQERASDVETMGLIRSPGTALRPHVMLAVNI
jgi:hypothetical protein